MHVKLFLARYLFSAIIFLELFFAPIVLQASDYVQYDYFRQLVIFLPSLFFGFVSGIIKFNRENLRFSLDLPFFILLGLFGVCSALFFNNIVLGLAASSLTFILVLEKILILEDRFLQASTLKAIISIIALCLLVIAWIGGMFTSRFGTSLFGASNIPLLAIIASLAILLLGFIKTIRRYIGKIHRPAAIRDIVEVCKFGIPLALQTALLQFVFVSSRDLAINVSESFAFNFALSLNILQFTIVGINTLAFTNQKTLAQDIPTRDLNRLLVAGLTIMLLLFVLNIALFYVYTLILSTTQLDIIQFAVIGLPVSIFFYASAFSMFNYYRSNGLGLIVIHALMAVSVLGLRYFLDYQVWQYFYFGLASIFLLGALGIFFLVFSTKKIA